MSLKGFCSNIVGILNFIRVIFVAAALYVFHGLRFLFVPQCCRRSFPLEGSRVLITGSGSGIGRALALELAKHSPAALVLWSKVEETNEETRDLVLKEYADIKCLTATIDVSDYTAMLLSKVSSAAADVLSELGGLDVLINNAGIVHGRDLLSLSEDDVKSTIGTNLLAHFWTIKAFLPSMLEAKCGQIVAVGSVAGIVGTANVTDYSAAKFGLMGLMESLDVELRNSGAEGVGLTTVSPYFVDSGLFQGIHTRFHGVLPILTPEFVARRTVEGIRCRDEFIYLPRSLYLILCSKGLTPTAVLRYMGYAFGAHTAMRTFEGRTRPV